MTANLTGGDYARIVFVTGVLLTLMTLAAGWLIEHTPLLATRAWMRAHRWPLIGLRWGARGAHKLGRRLADAATLDDDWHPLDEEEDDEQPAETPAHDRQPRAEEDDARREVRPDGEAVHAQGTRVGAHHGALAADEPADLMSQHHDDWASGRFTHEGEDDDDPGQAVAVRELRPADQDAAEVERHLGSRRDGHHALPPPDAGDPDDDLTAGDDYDLVPDGFGGWISRECAAGEPEQSCSYGDCDDPRHREDDDDGEAVLDRDGTGDTGPAEVAAPADLPVLQGHGPARQAPDEDIALTTGDDYDTDTLRIFAEANAEHHVRPHDPPGPDPAKDVDTPTGTGPGDSTEIADDGAGFWHHDWDAREPDPPRARAITRFAAVLRRHRGRPVNFWSVQALEDVCATAALLALAESVITAGAA